MKISAKREERISAKRTSLPKGHAGSSGSHKFSSITKRKKKAKNKVSAKISCFRGNFTHTSSLQSLQVAHCRQRCIDFPSSSVSYPKMMNPKMFVFFDLGMMSLIFSLIFLSIVFAVFPSFLFAPILVGHACPPDGTRSAQMKERGRKKKSLIGKEIN